MTDTGDAGRFVQQFIEFWRDPSPDRFDLILHPDVVLIQPLSRALHGLTDVQAEFHRITHLLPDLATDVAGWSSDGDRVTVEFWLSATIGGRPLRWRAVDSFDLRGSKAIRRVTVFDTLPVLLAVLGRPTSWWRWWRSGYARPTRWRLVHA